MSDDSIELSRRKILAGLGAVGATGAAAGLGTSAYFSDEESFDNNTVTAGELDLLLDYRVNYHGGPGRLEDVQAMGYPDASVLDEEEGTYLLEAVPEPGSLDDWPDYIDSHEEAFCVEFREDLINGDEVSPIHLQDVKPGDSGCLTSSLHLCDNPAYVWVNGGLVVNDDNGLTEPEDDVDETGDEGEGELAENIETTLWYDENCDCAVDSESETDEADVVLVLDVSGSMSGSMTAMRDAANGLVDELGPNANAGLVSYSNSAALEQSLTSNHGDVETAINALTSGGETHIGDGVVTAHDELTGSNARAGADKYMVVMSDGEHNQGSPQPVSAATDAKNDGIELFTVGFGSADTSTLESMATDSSSHYYDAANDDDLIDAFAQIGQSLAGERIIFEGTLAELTGLLSTDDGIPLDGLRSSEYDEVVGGSPAAGDGEGREPFAPGQTHCIGLDWELPGEVGNVVQSDSVEFDVGFYAEQARHNDGSGEPPTEA